MPACGRPREAAALTAEARSGGTAAAAGGAAVPLLAVRDLRIVLRNAAGTVPVVDGIGFTLAAGRTLAIVGESGCGKSLTALALMRLLPSPPAEVAAGAILFEGRDLLTLDGEAMRALRGARMAMIFQEPMSALNPSFTIGNQLVEAILSHRPVGRRAAEREALAILRRVRIAEPERRLRAYPHQLSGGMRQRIMIAMALANRPRLLIADEPTTALDVTIQAQILALMRELREETGAAIILITHDFGIVREFADDILVMYAGKAVEAAPAAMLFADPQHPYTLGLFGALPRRDRGRERLATIPGAVPAAGQMPEGCRFSTRCPLADARCRAEDPPLRVLAADHRIACWRAPIDDVLG